MLEAKLYEYNTFVTLTYADEYRPGDRSVHKKELQNFIKRLRKNSGLQFRYYGVGEYGDVTGREHYHIILFGYPCFYEEYIEASWPNGHVQVDALQPGGAGYIAGYTTKKLTASESVPGKEPEFAIMSRGKKSHTDYRFRGGIGYGYCKQIIKNITRDKLNFVGDDYGYIRIAGMLLPLDKYMRQNIDKMIGFTKIDQGIGKDIVISMTQYKNMNYPEAENDAKAKAEIKARQRFKKQTRGKKL
jgi:hypothetical protein